MTFEEIISGKGRFSQSRRPHKLLEPRIHCRDRTTLATEANSYSYCRPYDDYGPYTHIQVSYPEAEPPESWSKYRRGRRPEASHCIYAFVPVALVREYIELHGGEVDTPAPYQTEVEG